MIFFMENIMCCIYLTFDFELKYEQDMFLTGFARFLYRFGEAVNYI